MLAICALTALPLCAAEATLKGRFVDENEAPVDAAQVTVRPANASTQTNPTVAQTLPAAAPALLPAILL